MTTEQSDQLRQQILLDHLKRRLMFCEDEVEESYLRKEIEKIEGKKIDQISPRDI